MASRRKNHQSVDVLQSGTTIASIALGLLSYFSTDPKVARIVPFIVFLAGVAALSASVRALVDIRVDKQQSWKDFIKPNHSLGIIFWSILFLATAYIFIVFPSTTNNLRDILIWLANWFDSTQ